MAEEETFGGQENEGGTETGVHSTVTAPADEELRALIASQAQHLPPEAADYYRQQTQFIRLQYDHLREQRGLILAHLRIRRTSERLKSASQIAIALVSIVVAGFLIIMIYDAVTSRAIIVEAFDAPLALSTDGITGKVVAGALLDVLTKVNIKAQTHGVPRPLANGWSSENIQLGLPTNSISFSEMNRMLRARFGHDVHISGDLVKTETQGLALTVRGDGIVPKTFGGGSTDLQKIIFQAGEYIYGQLQPVFFGAYLDTLGRYDEELIFSKEAFPTATKYDRPYLLNAWGNAITNEGGSAQDALRLYQAALVLKPDYWVAHNNVINTYWTLGDEEGAWHDGVAMRRIAGGRPGRASEFSYANWDVLTWNLQALRNETFADADAHAAMGTEPISFALNIADIDWRLHDLADAWLRLQIISANAATSDVGFAHFVKGRLAAAAGDITGAAREMEAFGVSFADPVISGNYPGYDCWIAPAEEAAGHPDKADSAIAKGGHFVDCYRFRADILDHRGDWAAAQRAYASAVEIAPDLPAAYYSWGLALGHHDDLSGAIEKLAAAHERGPHWADPLKAWGDVLMRQNDVGHALAKYDAALVFAPKWVELQQARDTAAKRSM